MGKLKRFLAQVLGFHGWCVTRSWFETREGDVLEAGGGRMIAPGTLMVVEVERKWVARCAQCGAPCTKVHERLKSRRWLDLPWCSHPVQLAYAPMRLACENCGMRAVELLPWADPYQRETKRLQHQIALEAASMPVSHVAAMHGLNWHTACRAEKSALERWQKTRPPMDLTMVGVDEKYLGRRHKLEHKYVTIVSNLATGEPIWIGKGRGQATVEHWLATLSSEQKQRIQVVVMDMHAPFKAAIKADGEMQHVDIVHDPFHVMKRASEAVDELRRAVFFRAGRTQRALGRGKRWLFLRAWCNCSDEQRHELGKLLRLNRRLARAYALVEQMRDVLHAPDEQTMFKGLMDLLRRTERRDNKPIRKLHESIDRHFHQILALAKHRPPVGRVEALNNNWETLVRTGRGYRDLDYLLLKLSFAIANPMRAEGGVLRFLALGLSTPYRKAA